MRKSGSWVSVMTVSLATTERVGISHGECEQQCRHYKPRPKAPMDRLFLSHDVPRGFADETNVVSSDKETVNLTPSRKSCRRVCVVTVVQ